MSHRCDLAQHLTFLFLLGWKGRATVPWDTRAQEMLFSFCRSAACAVICTSLRSLAALSSCCMCVSLHSLLLVFPLGFYCQAFLPLLSLESSTIVLMSQTTQKENVNHYRFSRGFAPPNLYFYSYISVKIPPGWYFLVALVLKSTAVLIPHLEVSLGRMGY